MSGLSLLVGVAILVVELIVFYLIIRAAVNAGAETQKRLKHAWAQTELLLALARKQGVDEGTLQTISDRLR